MKNIELLIHNIKQSNLPETDKTTLIELLSNKDVDFNVFIKTFLSICNVSKEILKLFDIDCGD